jgi:hypothetical protein
MVTWVPRRMCDVLGHMANDEALAYLSIKEVLYACDVNEHLYNILLVP